MKYEYERISTMSTMSCLDNLSKAVDVDSWEFYNFLVEGYPTLEISNPSFFMKYFEKDGKENMSIYTKKTNIKGTPYCKPNTKRYNIKDKARHGAKGKKINDWDGRHWTRTYMTNPKKEKAMRKQIETDIQCMKENKEFDYPTIVGICGVLYKMVEFPTTKYFYEVLNEVLDFCTFLDLDSYTLEIIESEVFSYYERDMKEVNKALDHLDDAIGDLKAAQWKIGLYIELLSKFGINMTDKEV